MDLSRAIQYPFGGPNGLTKTVIGATLILLMPVFFLTGFFLLGYQLHIIRAVIAGDDEELPGFMTFAADLTQGIIVFAGTLLYYLPAFVLAGLGSWLAASALSDLNLTDVILYRAEFEFDRAQLGMMVLCFALALIWLLLSAPLVMAATARYAETGAFTAFTHILARADEVWEQRGAAGSLMLNLFIVTVVAQIANLLVSSFIPCLAGVYISFIQYAAVCHLNGQWGAHLARNRRFERPSAGREAGPAHSDAPRSGSVIRPIKSPPRRKR